ncbi:MAG: ParB/RepB/Spo0J family partition protein [Pararhodobacter sp.]
MADRKHERRSLGRGLPALMAELGVNQNTFDNPSKDNIAASTDKGVRSLPVESLQPNPDQPRRKFDEDALQDLAQSIQEKGIIQPLIVRLLPGQSERFEIVAGERRWRAAQLARLHEVPVLVREFSDSEVLEIAIIENIQRAELNAIEEAHGYQQLHEKFGHTQEKIATALGKSRSHIANLQRLLTLPEEVQSMVVSGKLTAGHARALITASDPLELAKKVVGAGLSVRQTEALARQVVGRKTAREPRSAKDADTKVLEDDLSANLGMTVVIDHRAGGEGQVNIRYKSLEQLDQLCQLLSSVR